MFPERWLAGNYRQTRRSRLNSWPSKHRRMLLAEETPSRIVWNYKLGRRRSRSRGGGEAQCQTGRAAEAQEQGKGKGTNMVRSTFRNGST
eukprot:1077644-Heterocapsa_arctica.AAC.1